jgi:DNA-binding transcriptional LysR family regulator
MELYQLECFRILCKYGNFTSASEELMVTQPAVSMAVKKLEEEYGVELIDRSSKAFALTQMGEYTLKHAIAIHNEVTEMRNELDARFLKKREVIRFAFPFTMCPSLLPELLSDYVLRNQSITLQLLQKGHAAIAKGLADRSVDIGIFSKDIVNPLLQQKDYTQVEVYASYAPTHRFCECDVITPEMLNGETLLFSKVSSSPPGYIRTYLEEHHIKAKREFHDGFPDGNVIRAQSGCGIALAPKHIAGENCAPLSPPLYCNLVVAWNGKYDLTQEQSDLIEFLVDSASRPEISA